MLTGYNEAFIIDGAKKDELIAADPKNAEIIKPILRGRDIKRYQAEFADLWLIFIPWHFPLHKDPNVSGASIEAENAFIAQYPAIYNHLFSFKDKLLNRNKSETGIRYEWYALQRCANTYYEEFEKEKIVWAETDQNLNLSIVKKGMFLQKTCFMIITDKPFYLISIMNSCLIGFAIRQISSQLGEKGLSLTKDSVITLPVPIISEEEQRPFEELVEIILAKKERGEATTTEEETIDKMVYALYHLTDEEIAHIEGKE